MLPVAIGNESEPIQLAQCCFPGLAISNAKIFLILFLIYIFLLIYTEAILSDSTRKPLWFEITKMLNAVLKNKRIVSFIIIFGTLSFPMAWSSCSGVTICSVLPVCVDDVMSERGQERATGRVGRMLRVTHQRAASGAKSAIYDAMF